MRTQSHHETTVVHKEHTKRGQALLVEQFRVSKSHARVALHRLLKTGDIISPARGLYVIVPPEDQPRGSIPPQELIPLIMKYLGANYYVALLSAVLFHGASHQKPARFQVISDKRIKHPSTFGEVEIDFIYKKSLLGLPTQNINVATGYLSIASPELVALDLLKYPSHAGGLNHIATVLSELIEAIDPIKLINLAKDTGTVYQLQRIGYILDSIDVMDDKKKKELIDGLQIYVQVNKPSYLALASEITKVGHPRCKKWRVIENTDFESDL